MANLVAGIAQVCYNIPCDTIRIIALNVPKCYHFIAPLWRCLIVSQQTGNQRWRGVFMFIYLITNKANGKRYVGQTTGTIERRWIQHCCDAKYKQKQPISRAIRKYGIDNFTIEAIIQTDSLDELNNLEALYIRDYNTISPNGYNLESGGKNKGAMHPETKEKLRIANIGRKPPGYILTAEIRAKLGASKKGNQYGKGRVLSDDQKSTLRAARLGKPLSAEHREKLSISHLGKQSHKGIPVSEETKAKLREKNIGKKLSDETKAKIRAASKGNQHSKGTKNHTQKHSDESKAKMSASHKEWWRAKREQG